MLRKEGKFTGAHLPCCSQMYPCIKNYHLSIDATADSSGVRYKFALAEGPCATDLYYGIFIAGTKLIASWLLSVWLWLLLMMLMMLLLLL